MKLNFITSCKPFQSESSLIIQQNAINSWRWMNAEVNINVFNRDETIKEFCIKNNINYIEDYESSQFSDLPSWRGMRNRIIDSVDDNDFIIWVNSDIIFDETLIQNLEYFVNFDKKSIHISFGL